MAFDQHRRVTWTLTPSTKRIVFESSCWRYDISQAIFHANCCIKQLFIHSTISVRFHKSWIMAGLNRRPTLNLKDGLSQRRGSTAASMSDRPSSTSGVQDSPGLSILSALSLLKWKNNSVKPKMLGFKELKRKKKEDTSSLEPKNANVFQLREFYSRRWYSVQWRLIKPVALILLFDWMG